MAAPDENNNRPEEESQEQDIQQESEQASESEDPLAYIDINRGQRSRTTTIKDAFDEAILLLRAGWKPYGPYYPRSKDDSKKRIDDPYMILKAPNNVGKVGYVLGKNMDEDSAQQIRDFYNDMNPEQNTEKQGGGAAAANSGNRSGSGRSDGVQPTPRSRSTNKPEEDTSHTLYPYLSKEDRNRPIVFDILKNAQNYQDVINDLGWESMVTLLQIVKIDPRALSENLKEFKKDPEKFKAFLRGQLQILLETALQNGYDKMAEMQERVMVEQAKTEISVKYVKELKAKVEELTEAGHHNRRIYNLCLLMMDDNLLCRLANAMSVYVVASPAERIIPIIRLGISD